MEQKTLSKWLKCILFGIGICGLIIYIMVIPIYGLSLKTQYPEFSNRFWPWLIFLWVSGIPCFTVVILGWNIAGNIGRDQSFCNSNAKLLKWISGLSAFDAGFFFIGNIVFLLRNLSHPSVVLASFIVVFAGVAIAVVSAVLSHLVYKATELQEQSDWTI